MPTPKAYAVLLRTSWPVAVTMLFAVLAWLLGHIADRLLQQPIIEINTTVSPQRSLELRFKNLTPDVNFRDVEILILGADSCVKFTEPQVFYSDVLGGGIGQLADLYTDRDGIAIVMAHFHPGSEFTVKSTVSQQSPIRVMLRKSAVPTVLRTRSIETLFIEYELEVMATLAVTAAMLLATFWSLALRQPES